MHIVQEWGISSEHCFALRLRDPVDLQREDRIGAQVLIDQTVAPALCATDVPSTQSLLSCEQSRSFLVKASVAIVRYGNSELSSLNQRGKSDSLPNEIGELLLVSNALPAWRRPRMIDRLLCNSTSYQLDIHSNILLALTPWTALVDTLIVLTPN